MRTRAEIVKKAGKGTRSGFLLRRHEGMKALRRGQAWGAGRQGQSWGFQGEIEGEAMRGTAGNGREGAEIRTPGKSEGSWEEATVKGTEVVRE